MVKKIITIDIQKRYNLGERDFSQQVLRRVILRGAKLQGINFEGADLSYADLTNADLSNANLSGCYLNEATLQGANFTEANMKGAHLIKAYAMKINCQKAIVQNAQFTGSFLTRANFSQADLTGALLNGSYLSGAMFQGALYNQDSCFDRGINPEKLGMVKVSSLTPNPSKKITIAELVAHFDKVVTINLNYLGRRMTVKNFEESRPDIEWLNHFSIDKKGKIIYQGSLNSKATFLQIKWLEKWTNCFIKNSSSIIYNFSQIIENN